MTAVKVVPLPGGLEMSKPAGQGLDPVLESDQTRARARDGTADPVVADAEVKLIVGRRRRTP